MGRSESTHGGWFIGAFDKPVFRPVEDWERESYPVEIPVPSSYDDWQHMIAKWSEWKIIATNPITGWCLWEHPEYGKRLDKNPMFVLPDISEEMFNKAIAMGLADRLLCYDAEKFALSLPRVTVCADFLYNGEVAYTFPYFSLEEFEGDFIDDQEEWSDGQDYYSVQSVIEVGDRCGIKFFRVMLED
mgnify:CR=1 FL=1